MAKLGGYTPGFARRAEALRVLRPPPSLRTLAFADPRNSPVSPPLSTPSLRQSSSWYEKVVDDAPNLGASPRVGIPPVHLILLPDSSPCYTKSTLASTPR